MSELLLGCGRSREKRIAIGPRSWTDLTTLDCYDACEPDIVWDLNLTPWPLESDAYDEVHAYEVLEHLGRQGDYDSFFVHFSEIWRVLKPGGMLFATVPDRSSPWAWGDPGHTRVISLESLTFLSQSEYVKQTETMTDYRHIYSADFILRMAETKGDHFVFILEARK